MRCCQSPETHFPLEVEKHHQKSSPTPSHQNPPFSATNSAICGVPAFAEFSFADLKAATNDFSSEFIVSESGEKAPNLVYKGRLKNNHWIAVTNSPSLLGLISNSLRRNRGSLGSWKVKAPKACKFDWVLL